MDRQGVRLWYKGEHQWRGEQLGGRSGARIAIFFYRTILDWPESFAVLRLRSETGECVASVVRVQFTARRDRERLVQHRCSGGQGEGANVDCNGRE